MEGKEKQNLPSSPWRNAAAWYMLYMARLGRLGRSCMLWRLKRVVGLMRSLPFGPIPDFDFFLFDSGSVVIFLVPQALFPLTHEYIGEVKDHGLDVSVLQYLCRKETR